MKPTKLFLALAVAVLLGACGNKKDVIWDEPIVPLRNKQWYTPTKVIFTDTATIVHVHIEQTPYNWVRLDSTDILSDNQGKIYHLIGSEGIEIGKEFFMSESGKHDCVLRYEPLPKSTKWFDMINSKRSMQYYIHAKDCEIELDIPKKWRGMKYAKNEVLSSTRFSSDTVTVEVSVLGYRSGMPAAISGSYHVIGEKDEVEYLIPINETGKAILKVPMHYGSSFTLGIFNRRQCIILAEPGEHIKCLMNLLVEKDENPLVEITGKYARTNLDLQPYWFDLVVRKKALGITLVDSLQDSTPEERLNILRHYYTTMKSEIDTYKITDAAKAYLRMLMEEYYINWQGTPRIMWMNANEAAGKFVIGDENSIKFISKAQTFSVTKDSINLECLSADYAHFGNITKYGYRINTGYRIDTTLITNKRLQDLMFADLLLRGFESPITLEKINKYVKDSTLVQLLKARISTNDDLSQLIAAMSNVHIDDYAAVEPEMLLPTILSRHKGKTVFVDLWGTWCAPCIEGHKRMLPLKEKMKDEDVVFIYLAAPDSSIDKWNTMIEDIAGEHYFLTLSQYLYIHNRYFFSKLPAYLLFDGNGKLILNHEGLIENDVLETHIRKVLE